MNRKGIAIILAFGILAFAGTAFASNDEVTIKRDTYGVPHVYAETVYGLFYGYGYAVAQDRLFQMEMAKRSTQGRVAAVLGEKYIDFDKKIRGNYNPVSIQRQLDRLNEQDDAILNGYAAGMNAWIEKINQDSSHLMPKQFNDFGFEPEEWTAFDVAMIFIGSMANRYADFNTELVNQQIYNSLVKMHGQEKGREIFDQLMPLFVEDALTTIPKGEWKSPDITALRKVQPISPEEPLFLAKANTGQDVLGISGMSNCIVLNRKKIEGAKAILINGPQFGWYAPAYVYSIGLHGAGFDIVGNTPFAYPVVLCGHSGDIAWGSTWGAGDMVDIYREQLKPGNPHEYLYKGKYLPMEERTEVIKVKGGSDVTLVVYRTIHGPVLSIDKENNFAFTKKRTWDGLEVESLFGWLHSGRAKNFEEWLVQAERNALNINWYYADKDGNIGYAFTGKYPKRSANHDNRLPASGSGDMEWQGLLPFSFTPRVLNPTQGYISNWNNKPAEGVMNPDEFWYSWTKADRVALFNELLDKKEKWSADEVWGLIEATSFGDLNAPYFLPYVEKAVAMANDPKIEKAALILENWNRVSRDTDKDGQYDQAATAIFRSFLPKMIEFTLKDDLGDLYKFFAATGYPAPGQPTGAGTNIQTGTKTIIESFDVSDDRYDLLNGEKPEAVVLKALSAAISDLEKEQGPDMEKWHIPAPSRPFSHKNFLGIPQTNESEAMSARIEQNRGTENDMVVFTEDGVVGYEVAPPGQSGFIAPDGTKGKHFEDQFKMYEEFGRKRMWFYPEDVDRNQESVTVLKY